MITAQSLERGSLVEWAGGRRATLAIVFTDVVGSAALGNLLADDRMKKEIRDPHFTRGAELIAVNDGRLIKTNGDSIMAVFRFAAAALDFALQLRADPGAPQLRERVRAAIHYGEVDVEAHDIQGAEVNFAGRLAHEIKGPEIWLSDPAILAVRRYGTGEHPILDWEPHRNVRFRGFETESFTLWSLVTTGSRSAVATPDEKASGLTGTEIQSKPSGIVDTKSRRQFDVAAQNYDRVDFVSSAEVVIDQCDEDKERGIYAQVDFIEHLYVESAKARIEFGVRRAIVTVDNDGPGRLVRAEPLRGDMARRNAKFVTLHEAPDAVSICVDPNPGRNSLAELSLPPTPRENYLCQLATATSDVTADELRAELQVSLDVEGLYLADDIAAKVVSSKKNRSKR